MADLYTHEQLCAAFRQLSQFSTAWELVDKWLKERCFMTCTTKVPENPLETYANETLRELYLEMQEFTRLGNEMFGHIAPEEPATSTEEE